MFIAKINEPKMMNTDNRINDSTRLRLDRYFTPRPTPDTAEIIDMPIITIRPEIRPTLHEFEHYKDLIQNIYILALH